MRWWFFRGGGHSRYRDPERIDGVAVLLVQGPGNGLVELLDGDVDLLGDVAHDGMYHLALVVTLLTLDDILGGDTTLREIDVTCSQKPSSAPLNTYQPRREARARHTLLLVDTEDDHDLVAPHADELLDTADTSSGQLGEENHAVDVIVLEELDVSTHLGDLPRLHVRTSSSKHT